MGVSAAAAAPKHGLRRIPAGTHPAGPAAPPAPTSESTHRGLVKMERFFIKRKNPRDSPCSHPLEGASACTAHRPARAFHDFPPPRPLRKEVPGAARPPAPPPLPRSPRCPRPAAGTDRQRGASGCARWSRRRRARAVPVAERSSLACSCFLTARRHRPRVPACHGQGHIPPPVPRQTSAGCPRCSGAQCHPQNHPAPAPARLWRRGSPGTRAPLVCAGALCQRR